MLLCFWQECPDGFYGENCKDECPSQHYGRFCVQICSCDKCQCDKIKGCLNSTGEYNYDSLENEQKQYLKLWNISHSKFTSISSYVCAQFVVRKIMKITFYWLWYDWDGTTLLNRKSPYDEGKDLVNLNDFTRIYSIFVFQPFLLVEDLYINQIET